MQMAKSKAINGYTSNNQPWQKENTICADLWSFVSFVQVHTTMKEILKENNSPFLGYLPIPCSRFLDKFLEGRVSRREVLWVPVQQ